MVKTKQDEQLKKARERLVKYRKHAENWCKAFFGAMFLIMFIIPTVSYSYLNVDEVQFCRDKLETYYPEFVWENVNYDINEDICMGEYLPLYDEEQRGGLVEVRDLELIAKSYKLVDEADIEYLSIDNAAGFFAILFGALPFALLFIWAIMRDNY